MTAYAFSAKGTANANTVFGLGLLAAGTRQIQIDRIEVYWDFGAAGGPGIFTLTDYTGAGFSGGSVVSPLVLRKGGPLTLATSRGGIGTVASGTSKFITQIPCGGFSVANYSLPYKYILAPGDGLLVSSPASAGNNYTFEATVFCQEMRLARSN